MTYGTGKLAAAGVAVWLDDLSRPLITSGNLDTMVRSGTIVGVTTNPTIFAKSISAGVGYSDQLRDFALRGTSIGETLRLLTAWDVRAACDVLRPIYESTGGRDGRVSIEVDPRISADSDRTSAEAKGLWWLVDRPNLLIKIPAIEATLPAITACLAEGISVNVTLIFSIGRYRAVADAFMAGLEQRSAKDADLAGIESVASFFVSRVDTEVDKQLAALPEPRREEDQTRLQGQAGLANARLAYEVYEEIAASARWQALAAKGARLQRLLWASTGVKGTEFAPTRYVTELVAPDTVNTMPAATLEATINLARKTPDTIRSRYEEARRVIADLATLGIDLSDVAARLETAGVASFMRSWDELIASVGAQIEHAGAQVTNAEVTPASGDGGLSDQPAAASRPSRKGLPQ